MYSGSRLTTLWPHVPIIPLEELLPRWWQAGFVFTCLRTASRLRANLAADFGPHSIDLRWLWNHLRHNQFNSVFYPNLIRVDPMEQKTAHFIKIRVLQAPKGFNCLCSKRREFSAKLHFVLLPAASLD